MKKGKSVQPEKQETDPLQNANRRGTSKAKNKIGIIEESTNTFSPKRLRARVNIPNYKDGQTNKSDEDSSIKEPKKKLQIKSEKEKITALKNVKGRSNEEEKRSNKKLKTEEQDSEEKINGSNGKTGNKNKAEVVSLKKSRGRPKKGEKREVSVKEEHGTEEKGQHISKENVNGTKSAKKMKIEEKTATERSLVKKGTAAVDGVCPIASSSHVYCENGEIWDCMLNQTHIQFNNNKYYIIQLLKDDNKNVYSVWMRWGRVGCVGQNALKPCAGNLENAKEIFQKKFTDKTRNQWEERESFEKVPGKYDLLKMDYSDGKDETDAIKVKSEEKMSVKKVDSKLGIKVKELIELICNVKAMEEAVVEMKYDAKKAPLGKLTEKQVKAGYAALKQIESIIIGSGKPSNRDLLEACNAFYTRVPHYFGMKVPPLIRTKQEIQEKLALLQALGDIQAAMNIINQPQDENLHPADQHYRGLECDIYPLGKEDSNYQLLKNYLETTHGKTHTMYSMELIDIFSVGKSKEDERFKDVGNRMLLWHGSRLTNWAGILSQGLKIAPPEAPCTGYMFGKGVYFADMASKSANYCMPSYQNKTGLLVLCDVALGKCNELLNANYEANKLPKGCNSVKGVGRIAPDPKNQVVLSDGITLPMGPGVETNINNKKGYTLQYNEYIVYDVSQIKIKYLLKVEFKFK